MNLSRPDGALPTLGGAKASVISERRERCPADGAPLLRQQAAIRIVECLPALRSADEPPARHHVKEHRPLTMAARFGAERRRLAAMVAASKDIFPQVACMAALIAGVQAREMELMFPFRQPTDTSPPDRLIGRQLAAADPAFHVSDNNYRETAPQISVDMVARDHTVQQWHPP